MTRTFLLAAAVAFAAVPASAAIIFADDFGNVPSMLNFNGAPNFMVSNGSVDRIHSGDFSINCAGNVGTCIDLDGSTGMAGRFETVASFNFVAGTTYRLSFDLSGNQRNGALESVLVEITGAFSELFVVSGDSFATFVRDFTVAAPVTATLFFDQPGGDNVGAILDNVRLESLDVAVPAPAALALFGLGVAALGLARRR